MSIWISRAAALLMLAACVRAGAMPSAAVPFLDGQISGAPPAGYCVDERASHQEGDGAVILMGRCPGNTAAIPALITVSVGVPGSSSVLKSGAKALSDYFLSSAGRAALARDGKSASVAVRKTALAEGALVLQVFDRGVGEYWRAILGLRGRLVTISVTAPEGLALPAEDGRALMERTIAAMRRANTGLPG